MTVRLQNEKPFEFNKMQISSLNSDYNKNNSKESNSIFNMPIVGIQNTVNSNSTSNSTGSFSCIA